MLPLAELKQDQAVCGLEPSAVVTVIAVRTIAAGSVQVVYRLPDGSMRERLLNAADEAGLALATATRPWGFDGDGAAFQLTCEAKRIDLAFLFDPMMAVHTSNVEPLPHQITAVYESMLPRQPLRYVLADDPGAGKTIMAGLYIRELVMRADARRVLVVAPGGLVEQWRDELFDKFGLDFRVFSPQLEQASPGGNPFEHHPRLIVRLDQMARNEDLQAKLCAAGWDLVVFDEAHKLAAHFYGTKVETTGRYRFAQRIGRETRHLLLMTATPHSGKEADFQLFLGLLDSDRFYGKFRDGVHKQDVSDLMRRMVKEELVKFDGTPLFPERKAYTVNYALSPAEAGLYEAVTKYVQTEMGKADQLDGRRKGSVGFALTTLQRRLASSPAAIHHSIRRRRERLAARVAEERSGGRAKVGFDSDGDDVPEDDDDLNAEEQETLEESLVDRATAAKTIAELEAEIALLKGLETQARLVVASGQDIKWEELSKLLQGDPAMRNASGRRHKVIVFTEHRDTLAYLHGKIVGVLGTPDAVVAIHGGTPRDARKKAQAEFWSDPCVEVLIATDAAGEGVNLQCAHLMVNYDLPWNPNRLEQRFGRIHRIGQAEVCHLWNLVAKETREGAVFHRLLEKLRVESDALQGRVFNVLGDVFEEVSLRDMILEAIRTNDLPETRAKLTRQIDHAFEPGHIRSLLERGALAQETMSADRLFKVKEEMERAEARRLQPYFVRSFFLKAFDSVGGTAHRREAERYEITHVPAAVRELDRRLSGRNRREQEPVLKCYERVAFTKDAVRPAEPPGLAAAVLMHPGHPLMLAVTDMLLEGNANLLRRGAVLVDPADDGDRPWLLTLLTHEVRSGDGATLSRRMQFARVNSDGSAASAGWAPHLDLEPLAAADRPLLDGLLAAPWLATDLEARAVAVAAGTLAPEHFREVSDRRVAHVTKTLNAVHERLTTEIKFWTDRWMKLRDDAQAGKDVRLNLGNAKNTLDELQTRLDVRTKELHAMRHVQSGTPVMLGAGLVVPAGLVRQLRGEGSALSAADAASRKRVEMLAMDAVRRDQEAKGHHVVDVSAECCGWDLSSYPPAAKGVQPTAQHIEVKGRVAGATTVTVTRNEILYAVNQGDKFVLAIVFVNPDDTTDSPCYLRNPFQREPDWGAASVNYSIPELLRRGRSVTP